MSAYRVKPGQIPKHLKVPKLPPNASSRPSVSRPPIRNATEMEQAASDKAMKRPWFGFKTTTDRPRDIAREHPHSKLRDPKSLRMYDVVVKASVPVLLLYFVFYAPAGEKSDIAIVRRWTEGIGQDIRNWWYNVSKDEEVDPQILLRMDANKPS